MTTYIRIIRSQLKLSQVELAKKLRIQPTYLSKLENGKKNPSWGLLKKLAKLRGKRITITVYP